MITYLRTFLVSLILILLLAAIFLAGYLFHEHQTASKTFSLLHEAHNILINHGLKEPPLDPALEYGMIRGMLQAYDDPYSVFLEPPQNELQSNALEGKFGGIGVHLGNDAEGYWVLFPFPDSPASKAGIQEGDRLLTVDDLPISPDTSTDTVQSAIRGPIGSKVALTVGRSPDYIPIEFTIKRTEIPLPSVTWHLDPTEQTVGVVKVNLMAASTPDEIQRAVRDLQARGATLFILDLRDNPGGYLTAGVDIARLFLNDGIIMQQQYRDQDVETFQVEKPGPLADIPLAVLINHGSASAAEIAAGGLKVHNRAPLIGSPSFGKDTVQLVFNLDDGSSLRVTAARWWIPGIESPLEDIGLQPDIPVTPPEETPGEDLILQTAIQHLIGSQ